ncbi:hypothetical protein OIV83_000928 [Microbotryomycetes sp. JL201]|nr:hypothetical protein OIV83_000928 [Microbotryomycetes sp. JL201]
MAVRHLARVGSKLAAEQTPAQGSRSASRCPGCGTGSSTTSRRRLASSSAAAGVSWATTEQRHQPSSSWAAIAKAGQAWYDSATSSLTRNPDSQAATTTQPTGAAQELVTLLKYTRSPDPERAWQLFAQADLEGSAPALPLYTLHALLAALHTPVSRASMSGPVATQAHAQATATAGRNQLRQLDVESSTAAAHQYDTRLELVRLRIKQAGGTTSHGDLQNMLEQYHALRYAPGASRVWDEFMQLGHMPAAHVCHKVFETMFGWTSLHLQDGGRQLAKASAQPLVRKALAILSDIGDNPKRVDAVLDYFFKILVRAQDDKAFFTAMRQVYGFDVNYPGSDSALATTTNSTALPRRCMGEQEVTWVLEVLADMGDLSKMVTVFEVFDSAAPSSVAAAEHAGASFFEQSFHGSTATPGGSTDPNPHPIGTGAFAAIIREAGRQKNGAIMRHYFDQLYTRWRHAATERIFNIEQVVRPIAENDQGTEIGESSKGKADVASSSKPLGMPATSPFRPYKVPATLVRDVVRHARSAYDVTTLRVARICTRDMIRQMTDHVKRLSAVLARFEESDRLIDSTAPKSLQLLAHEIASIQFQQSQLQQLYPVLVADGNVVSAYNVFHNRSTTLSSRAKRLDQAQRSFGKSSSSRTRVSGQLPATLSAHKEAVLKSRVKVIEARLELVKHRLDRLTKLGRAGKGRKTWDSWVAEHRRLQAELLELKAADNVVDSVEATRIGPDSIEHKDARLVSASAV